MINSIPTSVKMGSNTFYIQTFPPFHAMHVLGDVQKIVVPVLSGAGTGFAAGAAANMDKDLKSWAVIAPTVIGGLERLAEKLDGEQLEHIARLLLDPNYVAVSINGAQAVRLDENAVIEAFDGNPADMLALMYHVFMVNYMDFSRSSCIPAGIRSVLQEVKAAFRELSTKASAETLLSSDASKKEC